MLSGNEIRQVTQPRYNLRNHNPVTFVLMEELEDCSGNNNLRTTQCHLRSRPTVFAACQYRSAFISSQMEITDAAVGRGALSLHASSCAVVVCSLVGKL